jgi:hypothetical protein
MNHYQQYAPLHDQNYNQPQNRPQNQKNPAWSQQFNQSQYQQFATYKKQNKPEIRKDTINNRMHTRTNGGDIYNRECQYVPRLQTLNNEMCERSMDDPSREMKRNYKVEHTFNRDSKHEMEQRNNPNYNDRGRSSGAGHNRVDNRFSQYTFKNKKEDLNDRLSALGLRSTVQGNYPINKKIPFLDMRPQNTSEIDYDEYEQ